MARYTQDKETGERTLVFRTQQSGQEDLSKDKEPELDQVTKHEKAVDQSEPEKVTTDDKNAERSKPGKTGSKRR